MPERKRGAFEDVDAKKGRYYRRATSKALIGSNCFCPSVRENTATATLMLLVTDDTNLVGT